MTLAKCSCGEKYLVENIATYTPCPKCIKLVEKKPKEVYAPQQSHQSKKEQKILQALQEV